MRRTALIARGCALCVIATVTPVGQAGAAPTPGPSPIPVVQIDGRGFGHGVGMAQDGALAMGRAGSTAKQILSQFYPGTTIGKASGVVRVPVLTSNTVELVFPDGGEVQGNPASTSGSAAQTIKFAPGAKALVYRDGDGTRVRPIGPAPSSPGPTSTTAPTTTSTTLRPAPTTTTTTAPLIPIGANGASKNDAITVSTTTTSTSTTPTTAVNAGSSGPLFSGVVTANPNADGRVGVTPRNHDYRGVIEMSPVIGGVRFVNQVGIETYLRGMGEVRNPKWPAASLQSQAIAARTYALRAMAAGGELCDTQRCQVYLGSEAEYAAMDKAVAATAGQVLLFGKSLASAVYSANGGGHSATREEGFGVSGPNYPYLRAAPYLSEDLAPWSVTIALGDVARRLKYPGELTGVEVASRGPSGRATQLVLRGAQGDMTVSGIAFDAALGLRSTLFTLQVTTATEVAGLQGGSVLQAPPEEAAALAEGHAGVAVSAPHAPLRSTIIAPVNLPRHSGGGAARALAVGLSVAVLAAMVTSRRRARRSVHATLS